MEWDQHKREIPCKQHGNEITILGGDLDDLTGQRMYDYNSDKMVEVPAEGFDLLVSGFPCTGLSGLNAQPEKFLSYTGKTGKPRHRMIEWIQKAKPRAILLENVKQIVAYRKQDSARPIDIQEGKMKKLGYSCSHVLLNSRNFHTAQSRLGCTCGIFCKARAMQQASRNS